MVIEYQNLLNSDNLTPTDYHRMVELQRNLLFYQLVPLSFDGTFPQVDGFGEEYYGAESLTLDVIKYHFSPAIHGLTNAELAAFLSLYGTSPFDSETFEKWQTLQGDFSREAVLDAQLDPYGVFTPYSEFAEVGLETPHLLQALWFLLSFSPLGPVVDVIDTVDMTMNGNIVGALLMMLTFGNANWADEVAVVKVTVHTVNGVQEVPALGLLLGEFDDIIQDSYHFSLRRYLQGVNLEDVNAEELQRFLSITHSIQATINPNALEQFASIDAPTATRIFEILLETDHNIDLVPAGARINGIFDGTGPQIENFMRILDSDLTNQQAYTLLRTYSLTDLERLVARFDDEGIPLSEWDQYFDDYNVNAISINVEGIDGENLPQFIGYDPRTGYQWSDGGALFGRHSPEQVQGLIDAALINEGMPLTIAGSMGETSQGIANRVAAYIEYRLPFDEAFEADYRAQNPPPIDADELELYEERMQNDLNSAWQVSNEAAAAFEEFGTPWWRVPSRGGAPTATLPGTEADLDMWIVDDGWYIGTEHDFASPEIEAQVREVYGYPPIGEAEIDNYYHYADWFDTPPAGSVTFNPDGSITRQWALWQMPSEYIDNLTPNQ
ncbi:MAG: hypothetical protein AAFQ07_03090, partial [Chloroflexota bacterium]